MDELIPNTGRAGRRYSVVRYVDQWPLGRVRKVLIEEMTFHEALEFARGEVEGLESQEIAILDATNPGWEYEVRSVKSESCRPMSSRSGFVST